MAKFLLLAVAGLLALGGCRDQRSDDVAAIKNSYTEFRTALLHEDYVKATNYISSDYLALYRDPGEKIAVHFRALREANTQLEGKSWVKFDRKDKSKAWLFSHRLPGVGQGFVKETNGWKVTVEVLPIMH